MVNPTFVMLHQENVVAQEITSYVQIVARKAIFEPYVSKTKDWTNIFNIKVYKIPNMVMVGIYFFWFGKDFFISLVILMKILYLKKSPIVFNLIIGTSMRRSSGYHTGVVVRAVDCWQ